MLFKPRFPIVSKALIPGNFACRVVQADLKIGKNGREFISWKLRNLSNGKTFLYGTPIEGPNAGMFRHFIRSTGDTTYNDGAYEIDNVIDRLVEMDLEVEKEFYKAKDVSKLLNDPIKMDSISLRETFNSLVDRLPAEELLKIEQTKSIYPQWIDYLLHLASKNFIFTPSDVSEHCANILWEYDNHCFTFLEEHINIVSLAKILLEEHEFTLHFEDHDASKFKGHLSCSIHEKVSGLTSFSKKEVWINRVGINEKTWRFALAHELFHVLMHTEFYEIHSDFVEHLHYGVSEFESNASLFARGLLLPTDPFCRSFKSFCEQYNVDPLEDDDTTLRESIKPVIKSISELFLVSDGAVKWRSKYLNLLGEPKRAEKILYENRYSY